MTINTENLKVLAAMVFSQWKNLKTMSKNNMPDGMCHNAKCVSPPIAHFLLQQGPVWVVQGITVRWLWWSVVFPCNTPSNYFEWLQSYVMVCQWANSLPIEMKWRKTTASWNEIIQDEVRSAFQFGKQSLEQFVSRKGVITVIFQVIDWLDQF